MILYGSLASPFVRKVVIAFEEKGLRYERKDATPFPKNDELYARHPLGLIPYAELDGQFVPDSSVICESSIGTCPPGPAIRVVSRMEARATGWPEPSITWPRIAAHGSN